MPEVIIKVNKEDMSIKMEGVGFDGVECTQKIDQLTDLLGVRTIDREVKGEDVRNVSVLKTGSGR